MLREVVNIDITEEGKFEVIHIPQCRRRHSLELLTILGIQRTVVVDIFVGDRRF